MSRHAHVIGLVASLLFALPAGAQEPCPNCPPCDQNICPPPQPDDVTVPSQAYPTLQSGIDAVAPGGTVHVLPGRYVESLNIFKLVHIEGRHPRGKTPVITASAAGLDVVHYGPGGSGHLSHLTLLDGAAGVGTDLQGQWRPSVEIDEVFIGGGQRGVFGSFEGLSLRRSEVAGTQGNGLTLLAVARLEIERTLVRDGGQIGVLIYPTAGPGAGIGINRSVVTEHRAGGIHIVGDAKPVLITRSFVGFNGTAGITYERARGLVSQCTVAFNTVGDDGLFGDGIRVYRSHPVDIDDTELANNDAAGVWLSGCEATGGPAEAALADNTFSDNAFPIALTRPSTCAPPGADYVLHDDGGNRCLPCAGKACGCSARTALDDTAPVALP